MHGSDSSIDTIVLVVVDLATVATDVVRYIVDEINPAAVGIQKRDGCALEGSPDPNDFITTCAAQEEIYPDLVELRNQIWELVGP